MTSGFGVFQPKVVKKKRVFEWNENKYWAMKQTDKDAVIIGEIKKKKQKYF